MTPLLILTVVATGSAQYCASTVTQFERITSTSCVCPGDYLIYECVAVGLGATEWSLTGCPSERDRILLLHSLFNVTISVSGECNGGLIRAQGIEHIDTCYRSQLNITISPLQDLNNTEVMCIHIDGLTGTPTLIGQSTIRLSGPPEIPMINLMDANSTYLTFIILSPVISNCPRVSYSIVAYNCGSCPDNTNLTTIVCTNFTTSIKTNICNLTVGGGVCGHMPREKAFFLTNLRVPNAPVNIESIPVYLQLQERPGILAELHTSFNLTGNFSISNTIDGSATNFTIIYSDSISGESCSSPIVIPSSSCVNGVCNHLFDILSSSQCPPSANITTTVFASNVLGNGPPSNSISSDGVNNFVRVNFDSTTNRLNCTFSNLPHDHLKQCIANITYGANCDQQLSNLHNKSIGEFVTIPQLKVISDISEYCFTVVASSDNLTAAVRGMIFVTDTGVRTEEVMMPKLSVAAIIGIFFAALIFLIIVPVSVLTAVFLALCYWHLQKHDYAIEISLKNDIGSVIQALEVFEKLKININGFNTYLRHKEFKRQHPDLPGYSIYYIHCECSADYKDKLKDDLARKYNLIPKFDTDSRLAEKFAVKDTNYCRVRNMLVVTIKFPVEDKVGCLCRALRTLKSIEEIEIVGVNTRFIWESFDQYSNNYVKFKCSRKQKRRVINELAAKEITVNKVQTTERGNPTQQEQKIELHVINSPGNLASALCAFEDLDINITKINKLRTEPDVNTDRSHRNILVKCYCSGDDRKKLKDTLEKQRAEDVKIESTPMDEQHCNCVVTYSVWNEKGSLLQSLRAFEEHEINIVAINPLSDEMHNIEYQKNYIEFESTDKKTAQVIERIQSTNRAFVVRKP